MPPGKLLAFPHADHSDKPTVQITLYKRTFPVKDAPVSLSLVPFARSQVHTFPLGGRVYEAKYSEITLIAPDDAKVDLVQNRLTWGGDKSKVKSSAKEVFDLATAGTSGFRVEKGVAARNAT